MGCGNEKGSGIVVSRLFRQLAGGSATPRPAGVDLDDIDHALIDALFVDGRASYATLGDIVGLSRSSARSRVMRLIEEGIVVVHGRVDPTTLGNAVIVHVLARTCGSTRDVADRLARIDATALVTETAGSWDVVLEVHCRDVGHLRSTLDAIRSCPGVRSIDTSTILRFLKQRWSSGESVPSGEAPGPPVHLDELDRRLIAALRIDGRASFSSLAQMIGQPESSTRDRVVRLIDSRTVEICTIPGLALYQLCEFVGLLVDAQAGIDDVARALVGFDETTVVAEVSGRHTFAVEAWSPPATHLGGLLERVHGLPGVVGVDTLLFLHGNRFVGSTLPPDSHVE